MLIPTALGQYVFNAIVFHFNICKLWPDIKTFRNIIKKTHY